ncbi:MAG: CHAT domain-containing protein [Gammaproteobacteria bacterium]|nr:CHAT domain-containing protein [Gammaproteobacteria bacterium]
MLKYRSKHITCLLLVISTVTAVPGPAIADKTLMDRAATEVHKGQYNKAIDLWQQAIHHYRSSQQHPKQIEAWYRIGMAYFQMGNPENALRAFNQAQLILQKHPNPALQSAVLFSMGSLHLATGNLVQAEPLLKDALKLSLRLKLYAQVAAIRNELGNMAMRRSQYKFALRSYFEALEFTPVNASQVLLKIKILTHALVAAKLSGKADSIKHLHKQLETLSSKHNDSLNKGYLTYQTGLVYSWLSIDKSRSQQDYINRSVKNLNQAIKHAETSKDFKLHSMALGELARIYYRAKRDEDAFSLIQQAIFYAQQIQDRNLLAKWQWVTGRLHIRAGQTDQAIDAYQKAMAMIPAGHSFSEVDLNLMSGYSKNNIYIEFTELLLNKSQRTSNKKKKSQLLYTLRDTLESLKAAELQDYFQDNCVNATRTSIRKIDEILTSDTAILYPIVMDKRIELLLSHKNGIERFTTQVDKTKVRKISRLFRKKLEKRRTREYLPHAKQLYTWIIEPVSKRLNSLKIKTLVSVPDQVLRGIPFSALHDGQQFLVEKMALAISPGLELTDSSSTADKSPRVLLGGLTQSVQGFPALLHVQSEIDSIHKMYGGNILLNDDFQSANMKSALSKQHYQVAHIASHGEFGKNVNNSFLLTYDSRVRVNDLARVIGLGRFAEQPLELLTLSACYTAAGDERAALGLAGITVKAGARSALASLWPINDRATAKLMSVFYREWKKPDTGKAAALRLAQLEMLKDVRYRHPGYWSPYLMIGNWQ